MEIKIAHLYPNELNLYGENGNIKALKYALEQNNIKVDITNIMLDDKINFLEYDFIYIGSSKEKNLNMIKTKLEIYKNEIMNYIKKDKILLATGNAIEILSILNLYQTKRYKNRRVADIIATTSLCKGKIYGFQNTEYLINTTKNVLFNIEHGYSNHHTGLEGFQKNNFYATSIIGPILARNDNLTIHFVDLLKEKESKN